MATTPTYEEWAEHLASRFFVRTPVGDKPRRVYLAVDDDILDEIVGAPDSGEGAERLIPCVRRKLDIPSKTRIFEPVLQAALAWDSQPRTRAAPPFLPLLGLTVLAASRMDETEKVTEHNYYHRLSELLEIDFNPGPAFRDAVAQMYRLLDEWLRAHQGDYRGISTIPARPSPTHVGYPLSQAMFRQSDRRLLTRFFRQYRLKPQDAANASELLGPARKWAETARLSPGARRLLTQKEHEQEAIDVLADELEHWDEAEVDSRGKKVGILRIVFDPIAPQPWGLLGARPDGFPATATFTADSGHKLMLESSLDDFYDPHFFTGSADPWLAEALDRGLNLMSNFGSMRLGTTPVWVFAPNEVIGLTSQKRVKPGERHWILARTKMAGQVTAFLDRWAREGWAPRPAGAPPGWTLFRDVFIDRPPTDRVSEELMPLVPSVDARPQLVGGLRLRGDPGVLRVLVGAEPEVWVPDWLRDQGTLTLQVDEKPAQLTPEGRLELAGLGLGEGHHTVKAGPYALEFTSLRGRQTTPLGPSGTCTVTSNVPRNHSSTDAAKEVVRICGAAILNDWHDPDAGARPVYLRYGAQRHVFIGFHPGELLEVPCVAVPEWMRSTGLVQPTFEVFVEEPWAWVATKWEKSGWHVEQLSPHSPTEAITRPSECAGLG